MPSPIGHAMAGAMTAWIAELATPRGTADTPRPSPAARTRLLTSDGDESRPHRFLHAAAGAITPLAVTCAALAVLPDFDIFFHTHRTYSHSLGAAGIVWVLVALVAWRVRAPVVRTASLCAAAYASHVLLDWMGRDDSPNAGVMAWWPLTHAFYRSGLNMFSEYVAHPRIGVERLFLVNAPALAHEMRLLAPPFVAVFLVRAALEMRRLAGAAATRRGAPQDSSRVRRRTEVLRHTSWDMPRDQS